MKTLLLFCILFCAFASGASADPHIIFLVRHAERADANGKTMPDPELSDVGRERAKALATMLRNASISAIYASEYRRAQQTAAPLASSLGEKVGIIPAKETARLVQKLKSTPGNVLVVGHSNTLPEIMHALGIVTPITIGESDYDNLFLIIGDLKPQLLRLRYR